MKKNRHAQPSAPTWARTCRFMYQARILGDRAFLEAGGGLVASQTRHQTGSARFIWFCGVGLSGLRKFAKELRVSEVLCLNLILVITLLPKSPDPSAFQSLESAIEPCGTLEDPLKKNPIKTLKNPAKSRSPDPHESCPGKVELSGPL